MTPAWIVNQDHDGYTITQYLVRPSGDAEGRYWLTNNPDSPPVRLGAEMFFELSFAQRACQKRRNIRRTYAMKKAREATLCGRTDLAAAQMKRLEMLSAPVRVRDFREMVYREGSRG